MEHKLKNRYGDEITFIQEGTLFEMRGGNYYRYLFNSDNKGYYAVDPSGGPFVNIGMDMGGLFQPLKGFTIEEIEIDKGKIILKTKEK